MNSEHISTFGIGLLCGTAIALTSGYFFGTVVLHKVLVKHDAEKQEQNWKRQLHLQQAQEALEKDSNSASI